jgi:hypothetical protein
MQLQIVSFKQAQRLKELGFDWKTNHLYDFYFDNPKLKKSSVFYNFECVLPAPETALALKWFRDVKNVGYNITHVDCRKARQWRFSVDDLRLYSCDYDTYEIAENVLLSDLLEWAEE